LFALLFGWHDTPLQNGEDHVFAVCYKNKTMNELYSKVGTLWEPLQRRLLDGVTDSKEPIECDYIEHDYGILDHLGLEGDILLFVETVLDCIEVAPVIDEAHAKFIVSGLDKVTFTKYAFGLVASHTSTSTLYGKHLLFNDTDRAMPANTNQLYLRCFRTSHNGFLPGPTEGDGLYEAYQWSDTLGVDEWLQANPMLKLGLGYALRALSMIDPN